MVSTWVRSTTSVIDQMICSVLEISWKLQLFFIPFPCLVDVVAGLGSLKLCDFSFHLQTPTTIYSLLSIISVGDLIQFCIKLY
jgi:hypothetical protein